MEGDYTTGGGVSEVLPIQKGGGGFGKGFSHGEVGDTKGFEVVLTWELEVLTILMGGAKSFHCFKSGGAKSFILS